MKPRRSTSLGSSAAASPAPAPALVCALCGQVHAAVLLAPRERALCIQCGHLLARGARFGPHAAAAFAVTGLLFAIPAALMPLVTVGKLGSGHRGSLFTGIEALWRADMRLLAIWILVCGAIAPAVLLGSLVDLLLPARLVQPPHILRTLKRVAASLEHWAMPEVQVLAILVAFTKLGTLVEVKIGPGLWCYAAMSLATLGAWRTFDLENPSLRGGRIFP